jgi:hypothetical protein
MNRFLSDGWVDALLAGLNDSEDARGVELTLQQIVTGAPGGDVRYWTRFAAGSVEGGAGDAPDQPDVTISQEYETAVALSRGEINPQGAFMQGKLKITGNMGKLLQQQAAIQALGPAMSQIETEY